jgi:uncharacterized membrane protein
MPIASRVRLVAIALAYVISLLALPRLASQMPGQMWPPAWASRYLVALFLPTFAACLWLIFARLAARDPLRGTSHPAAATYDLLVTAAIVFVVGLHLLLLATALRPRPSLGRALPILLGALMVIVGNVLPRLRPNLALGVRTPWALADGQVWARTHRTGGYVVVVWGLAMLASGLAAPALAPWVMVLGALVVVVTLVVLSYAFARRRGGLEGSTAQRSA